MAQMISGIISLTVSILVITNVLIPTVKNTNTSAWSVSEVAMWTVVSLLVIIGMLYGVMNIFGMA